MNDNEHCVFWYVNLCAFGFGKGGRGINIRNTRLTSFMNGPREACSPSASGPKGEKETAALECEIRKGRGTRKSLSTCDPAK